MQSLAKYVDMVLKDAAEGTFEDNDSQFIPMGNTDKGNLRTQCRNFFA